MWCPPLPGNAAKGYQGNGYAVCLCYAAAQEDQPFQDQLKAIEARYEEIIKGLSLELSLKEEFKVILDNFKKKRGKDYAASRGEYLNGIIMAAYLKFTFIDAAEVIFFDEGREF